MSMFESDSFQWRETYFVLFDSGKRPTLKKMIATLQELGGQFQLNSSQGDDDGMFESLTLLAPDDFAALDVSYVEGEEVTEQGAALKEEMGPGDAEDAPKLKRLPRCNARFDIMHFEQIVEGPDDEPDEMLDPSALLVVMEALMKLTGGIGVDPQSGSLM
jgi:hypothetical protein